MQAVRFDDDDDGDEISSCEFFPFAQIILTVS